MAVREQEEPRVTLIFGIGNWVNWVMVTFMGWEHRVRKPGSRQVMNLIWDMLSFRCLWHIQMTMSGRWLGMSSCVQGADRAGA